MYTYKDKNVLVLGLGISGISTIKFFLRTGCKTLLATDENIKEISQELRNLPCKFFLGNIPLDIISSVDLIVLSPGIPLNHSVVSKARNLGIEIIGDIELFARENTKPLIAITGSNGKTTTVSLLASILTKCNFKVGLGGNIGFPVLDLLLKNTNYNILELSSFELETTFNLAPDVAVILNLSEDHLDRYDNSLEKYFSAKLRIFHNAKLKIAHISTKKFLLEHGVEDVVFFGKGTMYYIDDTSIHIDTWKTTLHPQVIGKQFLENALVSVIISQRMHLEKQKYISAINTFQPLAHRFRIVSYALGVVWINDSKATNPGSVCSALSNFKYSERIHLLLGGDSKGANFNELIPVIAKFTNLIIYSFGSSASMFTRIFQSTIQSFTLEESIAKIVQRIHSGDKVLLAPGCASFDQFKSYADRGEQFMRIIKSYEDKI